VDGAAAVLVGASESALPVAMGFRAGNRPAPAHSCHGLVLRPCLRFSECSKLFTVVPVVAKHHNKRCKCENLCLQVPRRLFAYDAQ